MKRMVGMVVTCLTLAGAASALAQDLNWTDFFREYCSWGHTSCMPEAERAFKQGKSVQEAVDNIALLRAGTIPVEKLSAIAAISSYQDFLDKASRLSPAELNRGQTEYKDKPDALLSKFAAIRGECGAIVSLVDKRDCFEHAMTAIIPARKG